MFRDLEKRYGGRRFALSPSATGVVKDGMVKDGGSRPDPTLGFAACAERLELAATMFARREARRRLREAAEEKMQTGGARFQGKEGGASASGGLESACQPRQRGRSGRRLTAAEERAGVPKRYRRRAKKQQESVGGNGETQAGRVGFSDSSDEELCSSASASEDEDHIALRVQRKRKRRLGEEVRKARAAAAAAAALEELAVITAAAQKGTGQGQPGAIPLSSLGLGEIVTGAAEKHLVGELHAVPAPPAVAESAAHQVSYQ